MKIDPVNVLRPENLTHKEETKKRDDNHLQSSSRVSEEGDAYDLDLCVTKSNSLPRELGPASHGCTINATCETCRQTDDCNHTHYCVTQNRCGHSDNC